LAPKSLPPGSLRAARSTLLPPPMYNPRQSPHTPIGTSAFFHFASPPPRLDLPSHTADLSQPDFCLSAPAACRRIPYCSADTTPLLLRWYLSPKSDPRPKSRAKKKSGQSPRSRSVLSLSSHQDRTLAPSAFSFSLWCVLRSRNTGLSGTALPPAPPSIETGLWQDRKSTRLNSSHVSISYA